MRKYFLVLPFFLLYLPPATAQDEDARLWAAQYDEHFQKYSRRYFGPFFNWRWFKAQAIAESGLDPLARSYMGALGLMQILPSTFDEIRYARPHFNDIEDPRWNIAAGIYYCRLLYEKWAGFPEEERLLYTFASYNAGYTGVLQALRQLPPGHSNWEAVSPHLPGQTRAYVARIREIMGSDVAGGSDIQGAGMTAEE